MTHATTDDTRPDDSIPAKRRYERRLSDSGRQFINVDLDANVITEVDRVKGNERRGITLDRLIRRGLASIAKEATLT